MSTNKTQPTDESVRTFLDQVEPAQRKEDALVVHEMMQEVSGDPGRMWGKAIVGYGEYHYVYESGREGDWMKMGFSPRKASLSLYIMDGFSGYDDLMQRLGKHKTGKSCLYINKLDDVDLDVLRELMQASYQHMSEKYD